MEAVSENRENALTTPTKKMSKTISERLKRSAGKVFEEVKETLNRPSRRNSDAELVKDTPDKMAQKEVAPATVDGKGSMSKGQRSWRALSSTLKNSLRKTFNLGSASISEAGEDVMKVFGADLDQVLIQERLLGVATSNGVPAIVEECLKFLIPTHQGEEGLFRISGMKEDIMGLREKVDGAAAQASSFRIETESNCHNISGLLKQYIRELPASLYPKSVHQELIAAGKIESAEQRLPMLQSVAKQLPYSNFALLKRLTCVLNDLLAHVEKTKMTSANLSTVWAPNLIWDRDTETDPSTCLAFSRDINLAIQFTIESAYDMFQSNDNECSEQPPKRRSVFDIQPELENASSSSASSTSNLESVPSSSATMDGIETSGDNLTPRGQCSSSEASMTAVTPASPGFEEMLALASSSSRKRPRSIWVGSATALNDELDSMMETSQSPSVSSSTSSAPMTGMTPSTSSTKLARSSKRRTRIISIGGSSSSSAAPTSAIQASVLAEEEEPNAKRRKVNAMPDLTENAIHELEPTVSSPRELTTETAPMPSPRKSSGIRASLRKSLRLGSSRASRASTHTNAAALNGASLPEIQLYYYMDSDPQSVALRKLLAFLHFIPREIRNAQNDPMSVDEAVFFAQTCHDIVVVRRTDKAYTTSHKVSDLTSAELRGFLSNEAGEPRSPAIIAGSTYIVGYDKQLKDIFKYYMHRTKKAATPINIGSK